LTPQQKKAIQHLLSGSSIRGGCKKVGISHQTYYRWREDSGFRKELDRLSNDACREIVHVLKRHAAEAARHLVGLMRTGDPVLKRRVCNDILTHTLKFEENKDLENRVRALEELAERKK